MSAQADLPPVYRAPAGYDDDLARLRAAAEDLQAGRIDDAHFKGVFGPLGIAEQRESRTYMIRPRLPAGAVLPAQLRAIADTCRRYGNALPHFTSRQNIQVHGVPLAQLAEAAAALWEAGLCSKGAGGNAVRNVASCADSGVCAQEVFDVAPYAVALTEFLLDDPASFELPRKYKIACSGCGRDCAGATVADLGLIATVRDGVEGFAVYAAGGLGARPALGQPFADFFPAAEVHLLAEALKRVFYKHGNRENRNHARIRFLVEDLGFERFRELCYEELAALRQSPPPAPQVRPLPRLTPPTARPAPVVPGPGYAQWRELNVTAQAQPGLYLVHLPLVAGHLPADALEALAEIAEQFGEGVLRATFEQNALLRSVPEADLPALYERLRPLGLAEPTPVLLRTIVPCTGASICRPGLCRSRGLAGAVVQQLQSAGVDARACGDLSLHISGCPNSCARQQIADIGLSGAARKIGEGSVPHYTIFLGGKLGVGETVLGEKYGVLPARNVPAFLADLLSLYTGSPECGDFRAFAQARRAEIGELIAKHEPIPEGDESYYYDWGAEARFLS